MMLLVTLGSGVAIGVALLGLAQQSQQIQDLQADVAELKDEIDELQAQVGPADDENDLYPGISKP
jgi:hypothetical protein